MATRLRATFLIGAGAALAGTLLMCDRSAPASSVANELGHVRLADLPSALLTSSAAVAGTEAPRRKTATGSAGEFSVDLSTLRTVGDRYHADMSDGRIAVLTLDPGLQNAAETVLDRAKAPRGAIVVTDRAGRILALAGRRTIDPKGGKDGVPDATLALEAWAPAASIFKVVSTSAMVEAGAHGSDRVCYHGGVRSVMESNLGDSRSDRRCENLSYGLAHSQNAIIAKMAHRHLDPARLTDTAHRFGFDAPLRFPAPAVYGTTDIPTDKGVEFAKTAAGFTGVRLSVLGGALLAGTIANHGNAPTPTIIAAIIDNGHETPQPTPPAPTRVLEPSVAAEVAAMMTETCAKGSAAKAFRGRQQIPNTTVAGKTGTLSQTEPFYLQYSWFVGYAPANRPALTVSVLLGNAELWHMKAHAVARSMLSKGLEQPAPRATRAARR